ncbi:hypothetical protein CEQ90_16070 [Lewinellaceae bacterium SD302]|nr:hypothetical protein CEQ90_16070 [Lewinellaceae bacterium SD302]
MKKLTHLLLLTLAFQLLIGCTTRKSRADQGVISKAWHNMNAHYNGYFNAAEILEESVLLLNEQHVDNYNQQLDMFPYLETDNPSVVYEELDRAVEKVTVVSRIHPYSNWTDDCYLLAGQAMFMKRDYETAEKTFRFLVNEYRPKPKRRKIKKNMSVEEIEEIREEEAEDAKRGVKVEKTREQLNKERSLDRKAAAKERDKIRKARAKERKAAQKQREKERKQRAKDRKKGIRTPRPVRDTTTVKDEEPEEEIKPEVDEDAPFVGMISIFNESQNLGLSDEPYGKKSGSYIVKHRPSFQEGRLWLAWTLVKRDNYDQAQLILTDLRNDRGTFSDVRHKALAVQAFLYLESGEDARAIPYLMEAGEATNDRNESARFYYIAGQLHQQLNETGPAYAAFEKVVKENPEYALEFGARLNMAQNDFLSGSGSAEEALKKLEKMLKDDKNLEYESQLYFSMANIALRSNDRALGMEYLRKAIDSPSAQANNRVEAYALLAKLNYEDSNYLAAKLYYDSTLTFMPQSDIRYDRTKKMRDDLVDIAGFIVEIEEKDSLLRLAELPEEDRKNIATKILEQQREAKRKTASPVGGSKGGPEPGTSDYWAYDPREVRRGARDFNRKFSDRPLEDNWRRSDRTSGDFFDDDTELVEEDFDLPITPEEVDAILQGVPTDDKDKELMRLELQKAYFNLGRLYRNKLEDNGETVTTLESMHQRFPRVNDEAESWYYLYLAHNDLSNVGKANEYKNKLAEKWPDTKFAKILNDPNFANSVLSEEAKLERAYDAIYGDFQSGNYQLAYDKSRKELSGLFGKHPLKPKYALLMAMANGNIQGKEAYIASLKQLISQYPGTEEEKRAKEILRLLGETGAALPGGANQAKTGNFKAGPNELHYMVLVFDSKDVELNKAKIVISDYNNKYNKTDRLRVTNVYLGRDNSIPVLVMRRFKNQEEAMEYYDNAGKNKDDFLSRTEVDYKLFPVSQSNYREILKARNVEGYEEFFNENY